MIQLKAESNGNHANIDYLQIKCVSTNPPNEGSGLVKIELDVALTWEEWRDFVNE